MWDSATRTRKEEGEDGEKKKKKKKSSRRKNVSRREYSLYALQTRPRANGSLFQTILSTLMLGQLWVIDQAMRVIRQRNDNMRKKLVEMRGSSKKKFMFSMLEQRAKKKGYNLGYSFKISKSCPGSIAWYRERYEHSMAMIHKTEDPDLFITFTGNYNWKEIQDNLLPNPDTNKEHWQNNCILVNDVFWKKCQEFIDDVVNKELFGPVASYAFSIEFQKRGMPHMHFVCSLVKGHKLDTPSKIDQIVWARLPELPDVPAEDATVEEIEQYRRKIHIPDAYCHQRLGKSSGDHCGPRCGKGFPHQHCEFTYIDEDGTVHYCRPGGASWVGKNAKGEKEVITNAWVVPYKPYLLEKYDSHINVLVVSKVHVLKYIYKYVFKGDDKALVQFAERFEDNADAADDGASAVVDNAIAPTNLANRKDKMYQIKQRLAKEMKRLHIKPGPGEQVANYDEAILTETFRQMTANEGAWILQSYPLAGISHLVKMVHVHEEGDQPVYFFPGMEKKTLRRIEAGLVISEFMAWMNLNVVDASARGYTFDQVAREYRFDWYNKKWVRYARRPVSCVTMIAPVNPRRVELFAIRELARVRTGIQSFDALRTVGGVLYETNVDAAIAMGLLTGYAEHQRTMQEAVFLLRPPQVRRVFVNCLLFGHCNDPRRLFFEFLDGLLDRRYLVPGLPPSAREVGVIAALYHIKHLLRRHGSTLGSTGLPVLDTEVHQYNPKRLLQHHMDEALDLPPPPPIDARPLMEQLRDEQMKVFNEIVAAIIDGAPKKCFFLQASGGCGKTFVYRALEQYLTRNNISVISVASTGIASILLRNGTTAHRRFMLPLNCGEDSRSRITMESYRAQQIRSAGLIIFDEATMADKFIYNTLDILLKDIMKEPNEPFGGKVVLLGGDAKQLAPVVTDTSAERACDYTLFSSPLWEHFKLLQLHTNMRALKDAEFAEFLEETGRGLYKGERKNYVRIEKPGVMCNSAVDVVKAMYEGHLHEMDYLRETCVLAIRNTEVEAINNYVLGHLPGIEHVYISIDTPAPGIGVQIAPEYLADLMESGMPPHNLRLKVNAIVMLLRNLNPDEGLCNGTRMKVSNQKLFPWFEIVSMHRNFVQAQILEGRFAGRIHAIGKIKMSNEEVETKKTKFTRRQLPLRLAYCLTINKSQGQTFRRVGLILENIPFAHGHLYVALSRVHSFSELKVFSKTRVKSEDGVVLVNIVDDSILEAMRQAQLAAEEADSVAAAPSQITPRGSQGLARLISREETGRASIVTGLLRKPLDVLRSSVRRAFKPPLLSADRHPADANLQSSAPSTQIAPRLGRPLPLPLPPPTRPRRDDPNLDASFPSSLEASQMGPVPAERPWTPSPPLAPRRGKHSAPPRPAPPPPIAPRRRNVPDAERQEAVVPQFRRGLSTPGLLNRKNDCFLNAVVQVLRRMPRLVNGLCENKAQFAAMAPSSEARDRFAAMPLQQRATEAAKIASSVDASAIDGEILLELCRLMETEEVDTTKYLRNRSTWRRRREAGEGRGQPLIRRRMQ